MNSKKLKLVIILIFLFVNLFFLFELKSLRDAKSFFNETEIAEAVEVLASKGIKISPETVLREKVVPETVKLDFTLTSVEDMAKSIMREEYGSFKIPEGQRFTNDKESFSSFYDFSFEYQLFDYGFTTDSVGRALTDYASYDEKQVKKAKKHLEKLLSEASPDSHEITVRVNKYAEKDGFSFIEATEYIDGYEIDGAVFLAVIDDGNIVFLSGKLYFSNQTSSYTSDFHDSINILFEIDETDFEIKQMELIYFPVSDKNNAYYLTPAYKFTYENGKADVYDATSGIRRTE